MVQSFAGSYCRACSTARRSVVETGIEIAGDVRAQRAPAALGKDLEIAARLRRLDDAERVGLAGHRQVLGIVAGDLQEDAAVRPALVGLSRRMLEARPEADAGRRLGPVADHPAEALHHLDMGGVALDIGEQRGVIAGADPPEMRLQRRREARRLRLQRGFVARIGEQLDPVAFEERALLGQRPGLLIGRRSGRGS